MDAELDPEQADAASPEPGCRQIVIAPPGCGKTEVVAHLLQHLVEEEDLSPYDELLVISFSRAAVNALQRRASGSDRLIGLGIRTLDSLASEILGDLAGDDAWLTSSFDSRIEFALELVRREGLPERLAMLRHVVVDEAQDLVGSRADLVLEIIGRLGAHAGFTVLGDPLQAVYNFQLTEDSQTTSSQFFASVAGGTDVVERRLLNQYRARADEPRAAARLGDDSVGDDDRVHHVRTFVAGLTAGGDVGSLAGIVKRWQGTTAFLCRDNGVALEVATELRAKGLAVTVRAPAEELPIDPWVGRALTGRSGSIRQDSVDLDSVPIGPIGAWRLLKAVERDFRAPDRLDVRRLATTLSRGGVPIDLRSPDSKVIVSTIHRSKGLEFDNVVLVNAGDLLPAGATQDELSVAFVGVTRARDQVLTAKHKPRPFLRKDTPSGRWIVGGYQKWMTFGFEIRASDSAPLEPIDLDEQLVGAEVTGKINPRHSDLHRPIYDLEVGGIAIARTTEAFSELLVRRLKSARKEGAPWPSLSALIVEALETRVTFGDDGAAQLSVAPRISGLASIDWHK